MKTNFIFTELLIFESLYNSDTTLLRVRKVGSYQKVKGWRKSMKIDNIQWNGQNKKDKRKNKDLQNAAQKTRTPQNTCTSDG